MILDYVANDATVQMIFLIVLGVAYCFTLFQRYIARENAAARMERHQQNLAAINREVGRSTALTVN